MVKIILRNKEIYHNASDFKLFETIAQFCTPF